MSMAAHPETSQLVCGINSSEEHLKQQGDNQNCRLYGVKDGKYVLSVSLGFAY